MNIITRAFRELIRKTNRIWPISPAFFFSWWRRRATSLASNPSHKELLITNYYCHRYNFKFVPDNIKSKKMHIMRGHVFSIILQLIALIYICVYYVKKVCCTTWTVCILGRSSDASEDIEKNHRTSWRRVHADDGQ